MQRQIFSDSKKELTKDEYERLLDAAKLKGNERLYLIMQTICVLGIRVSELKYITVHAIKNMSAEISCKGKTRTVLIPKNLCKLLQKYAAGNNINSGSVFVTKSGRAMNRSNIWSDMKKLCEMARVSKDKVFPHNLRHLFARTYYSMEKDIVRLADILGHSNINTTRIYTMEVKFITVEAVRKGRALINCKGKMRVVILPAQLCKMLNEYSDSRGINAGAVFVTKSGTPVDRSNIWSDMKNLCRAASVPKEKVFPHNLRHLFARTYYTFQKDVVRLADILGHSSVNTTRIYTMETGDVHRLQIQRLGLLRC